MLANEVIFTSTPPAPLLNLHSYKPIWYSDLF
jgi:hypothetical protein